jgi:hypothetical protein
MFNTTKLLPLTVDLIVFSAVLAGIKEKGGYSSLSLVRFVLLLLPIWNSIYLFL